MARARRPVRLLLDGRTPFRLVRLRLLLRLLQLARGESGRPVEPLRHPVAHEPPAVGLLHELDVRGHRRPSRTWLREHEHLEPDGVGVRVLDEAPGPETSVGGGIGHDGKIALVPFLSRDALLQARRRHVPGPRPVLARHRAADELLQRAPDRLLLRGRKRRVLRLDIVGHLRPLRVLRVSWVGGVDREIAHGDEDDDDRPENEATPPAAGFPDLHRESFRLQELSKVARPRARVRRKCERRRS